MEIDWFIFGCGFIGALAPELLRAYQTKRKGYSFSLYNLLASLGFFGLGGFLAFILQSPTPIAAFYTGISAPIIVSKALEQQMPQIPKGDGDIGLLTMPATKKTLGIREYFSMLSIR